MNKTVIELNNLSRTYILSNINKKSEDIKVRALRNINLSIEEGEFIAIMGPSGSGKSTLMNILGCLDIADTGKYILDGIDVTSLDTYELATIRNRKIGFVFQSFNLLPRTSALDNVERPTMYLRKYKNEKNVTKLTSDEIEKKAKSLLAEVGMGERLYHFPNELSGGQQQRVAIARSMINDPSFILADEPTGNLDSRMSLEVLSLFQKLNNEGKTIIMVTHEKEYANYCKRIITLKDGKIIKDENIKQKKSKR